MPDPVVPGPPASVLAQISNNPGSDLPLSNPAFTGRATFSGGPSFPFLPSLMTEVVDMPQAAFLDADVEVGGNLTVDGTFFAPVFAILDPVALQTSAYTASGGQFIPCSTASAAFTVALPAGPEDGTLIGVQMVVQASSRAVTVAAAGTDRFNVSGGPTMLILSSVNQGVLLQYSQVAGLWYQIATAVSGSSPTGAAGGALSGTYPNPGLAIPVAVSGSSSASLLTVTNTQSGPGAPPLAVVSATAGDRAIGASVSGDTLQRFRVNSDGALLWGGGAITQDVELSRSGSGALLVGPAAAGSAASLTVSATGSASSILSVTNLGTAPATPALQVTAAASGDRAVGVQVTGDTSHRFASDSTGLLSWGTGATTRDVQLSRTGSAALTVQPVSAGSAASLTVSATGSAASIFAVTNLGAAPNAVSTQLTAAAATDRTLGIQVSGDTNQRLRVRSDGLHEWGPGNATVDTNLYRSGTNVLATDDTLAVGINFSVAGTVTAALNMGGNTLTHAGSQQVTLPWMAGAFGDGSDGSVVMNGSNAFTFATPSANVYTLTRDVFTTSLTIAGTVVASVNGYRIFCAGTVTNSGTVSALGNSATAGSNQHTAAGATPTGTLGGGRPGSAGVASGTATTATASAGVGTGAPGAGGNGSTGFGGQSAGTPPSTDVGWLRTPWPALTTALFNSSAVQRVDGGGGGSGGGGDGTNFGGGGGGGGGVVGIFAWSLVNNGVITAAGGNGGAPTSTTGGCGGGGGGAGGLILAYTLSAVTGSGSTSVAGGNGGAKVGTGANGSNGSAGNYLNIVLT